MSSAASRVEEARVLGAEISAPYEYYYAREHLRQAELYASAPPKDGVFSPPIDFPPHERSVEIDIDVGNGAAIASVIGGDLTHEYVSENADYRS